MGTMGQVRNLLERGHTPRELVRAGYAKSTVYAVKKKMPPQQGAQSKSKGLAEADHELAELRRQKERAKLVMEIEEMEAKRPSLARRLEVLERQVKLGKAALAEVALLAPLVLEAMQALDGVEGWQLDVADCDEIGRRARDWFQRGKSPLARFFREAFDDHQRLIQASIGPTSAG